MKQIELANQNQCTGCGACANICPKHAIQMLPDEEGFLQPQIQEELCIHCGKCEKTCPVLNPKKENSFPKGVVAVRASDEIRQTSSSGGVFSLLAHWIFQQNGVVCGAAFDDDFQLKHIAIEREEELESLKGSKYLQSNTVDIYKKIKDYLEKNRAVLFVGTPCQVAALYRITGRQDRLYTIDIFCHGVPSQNVFTKYLKETAAGRKVESVKFRDKRFGWACNHIRIQFTDGTSYEGDDKTDAYEKGFFRNLWLRRSCETCTFSEFPREGDLSIGDFWGITKIDASQNDGKGTSVVLVNNQRGKELYESVIFPQAECKKIDVAAEQLPNRVHAGCVFNKNRDRFFHLIKQRPILEAVPMALNKRYDIGLVSNYCAPNFGGALTHYALYHTLEDLGYSTLMIEAPLINTSAARVGTRLDVMERCFLDHLYPAYAMSKFYRTRQAMKELNQICQSFVVGSDQLFQYSLYQETNQFVSLDWVESRKKKIAVAASFGHGKIFGDPKVHAELSYWLSRYDYFSVREDSAVDICQQQYGIHAVQILDPVFLVNPKHYETLIEKATVDLPKKYVGFYILDPSEEKANIIQEIASRNKIDKTGFSEFDASSNYVASLENCNVRNYRGEERLKVIRDCDFFVTDSFHGTCLAIIMKKPFVTFLNSKRGESRFYSILKLFCLEDRLVTSFAEFLEKTEKLYQNIDWGKTNGILTQEKKRSMDWLTNALCSPKLNRNTEYDILIDRLKTLEDKIQKINTEIDKRKKEKNDRFFYKEINFFQKAMKFYHDNGLKCFCKKIIEKIKL